MAQVKIVTSRDNPTVKKLCSLAADARETRRQGRTLLDGPHLIDAYRRQRVAPEMLVVSESGASNAEVARLIDTFPTVEALQLPDSIFREISGVTTPVGILAVIAIPETPTDPVLGNCVLLVAVQDAGNVGAILRTAAAAGVCDIALGAGCAGAWTPRVLRAAQGAHFVLRIREQADLVRLLKDYSGTRVAAVARGGMPPFELDLSGHVAWIFGNEGSGVSDNVLSLAPQLSTIPLAADTESLNVAAATAICLFESMRQRRYGKGTSNG